MPRGFLLFKTCEGEEKQALSPKRCNDRIYCPICAKEFSDRKRFKDKSLIKALEKAFARRAPREMYVYSGSKGDTRLN